MTRFFTTASLLTVSFAAAQASANVVLMDPTTNNGSFTTISPGESNGNITQTGGDGGERYLNSGGTSVSINGWSATKNTAQGGTNHSNSGKADEGLNFWQVGSNGTNTVTSSTIAFNPLDGNTFRVQAAFATQFGDGGGDYAVSLIFDPDGTPEEVVIVGTTAFVAGDDLASGGSGASPVAYGIQIDENIVYGGAATDRALRFVINSDGNTNSLADDFRITQIPEPSSLALLGLGGLAMLRRRRQI